MARMQTKGLLATQNSVPGQQSPINKLKPRSALLSLLLSKSGPLDLFVLLEVLDLSFQQLGF